MSYATLIPLEEIKAEDVLWLEKALEGDAHGVTAKDILDGVQGKTLGFWRLNPQGIAITGTVFYPAGKEMTIAYVAGEDYYSNVARMIDEFKAWAKENGFRWLSGFATRRATEKAYSKYGSPGGKLFITEV